ncbi:hypothetical protein DXG01_003801 [Tephrocybe rancida]|nr:hypothetical protein DXG01_003801 [Tephrocybe rancida]
MMNKYKISTPHSPSHISFHFSQTGNKASASASVSQLIIYAPFSHQDFKHQSLHVVWGFVRKLRFNSVGRWLSQEVLMLKERWEAPLLTLATIQPTPSIHALRTIREFFSEIHDMARSLEVHPVWYIAVAQRVFLDEDDTAIGLLLVRAWFILFTVV